ncbi:ABC transporter substrate-binding protein [Sphaerisporangium sp. NPDC051011]|uniref:ABC transporter substrate-binding protein n=1 Tax=Sphaerisporangium sp. NPDC051011 TaxID=3155792 RepID=UPI0033EEE049
MTRNRTVAALTAVTAIAIALAGCSSPSAAPTSSAGKPPASSSTAAAGSGADGATDCPATANLSTVPKRVVTLDTAAASFLIQLGLGDRIVATADAGFSKDFTGSLREEIDKIPAIAQGSDSANKEKVIAAKSDLVTGVTIYALGAFPGTPTQAELEKNGIAAMIACDTAKGEATDIDATYRYITNLAETFHVQAKGEELVASMKKQIAAAAPTTDANVPVLALSEVPSGGAGINTIGGSQFGSAVITLAGGKNIAASTHSDFATLSSEQVATANPKVIVAISGLSTQTPDELVASIKKSPLLADADAVKNNHIVVVSQGILCSPSLLNADAITTIADAIKAAS